MFEAFGYSDFPITLGHQKVLATKLHIIEVTPIRKVLPEDTLLSILKLLFQTFGYIDFPITLSHQKVLATKLQILEVTLPLQGAPKFQEFFFIHPPKMII